MRLTFIYLLAISVFAIGCQTQTVEPTTGAITGSVLPANGASKVFLISGTDTIKVDPKADGTYEVTEINPGNYSLSAKPKYGFLTPKAGPIIINAGFTTQAYPVRLPNMPASGTFSVAFNDTVFTGTPSYDLFGDPGFSVVSGPYKFTFKLPKISGTDTFNTATNPDLEMKLQIDSLIFEANSNQGNLALKVIYFDKITKRGDATFSFTAVRAGEKDIVGTDGKLQFVQLRP